MTTQLAAARTWVPPPRPEWVERANAEGLHLDLPSVIPLSVDNLVATAQARAGLSDFGSDEWREPLTVLVKSLNEEADLHLLGRLMTRSELVHILEGRLHIEETYRRHPEIADEEIVAPLLITGAARTGTTALYNLLAADPDNRAPLLWEIRFPHPPPESATYDSDPRIEQADQLMLMWERICPEFPLVHEQRGYLPVEDNYLLMYSFTGPNAWQGKTPAYVKWLVQADLIPALDYTKRIMRYLQWKHHCKRWVLKSPSQTVPMRSLFDAFPDALMVFTHRDPAKLTVSSKHLLKTVFWARSDNHQSYDGFYEIVTDDATIAGVLDATIDAMEDGTLPKEQILNLLYLDFVQDNVAAVRRIYEHFGIESSEASYEAMTQYAKQDAKRRAKLRSYRYEDPSAEEVSRLRLLYHRYQDYFCIPSETAIS